MKIDYKDFLLSWLVFLSATGLTFFLMKLIRPLLSSQFPQFFSLAYLLLFLAICGSFTLGYLRALNRLFPLKAGEYATTSPQATLWKHQTMFGELGGFALWFLSSFSGFRSFFYRIRGMKLGKSVAIGKANITDPLLTEAEDFTVIGDHANIISHTIVSNKLILGPVILRRGCTVGVNTVIMPGVEVGENSIVAPASLVRKGTRIPPKEFWGGVPAKKIKDVPSP